MDLDKDHTHTILDADHSQKLPFFVLGFATVILIIFSFQFIGKKIEGIQDNYWALFCSNLKEN